MGNFFSDIGMTLFYRPLYNALLAICTILPDPPSLGLAIILLALGLTVILLPLNVTRHLSSHHRRDLAHAISAIADKYADHPERGKLLTKKLLQENTTSIVASIVTLLIQTIVGLTLYTVLKYSFGPNGSRHIYEFITMPDQLEFVWLKIDMRTTHQLLSLMTAIAVFLQSTISVLTNPVPTGQDKLMQYAIPITAYLVLSGMPSGLSLFFLTLSALGLSMTLLRESTSLVARQFANSAPVETDEQPADPDPTS